MAFKFSVINKLIVRNKGENNAARCKNGFGEWRIKGYESIVFGFGRKAKLKSAKKNQILV
jgi:hypothetical protein